MLKIADHANRLPARERVQQLVSRAEEPVKPVVRWSVGHLLPRTVMRRAARHGDLQGRLIVDSYSESTADLEPLFAQIREAGPLHRGGFSYVTTRHAVVKEALTSNDLSAGIIPGNAGWMSRLQAWAATDVFNPVLPPSLLATEPPDHTRYRKLVTRVFTARAVEGLRQRTEVIARDLLDDLEAGLGRGVSEVDLVETYCGMLPVTVISEILGVPTMEREKVLRLGTAAAPSLDMGLGWREFRAVEAGLQEFDDWLTDHLEELRRNPGDNLLSKLVAAREDGVGLTDHELRATAGLVLAAGFETTVNLLGNGVKLLCDHPDQLAQLRARPELWGNAVDEVLRVDPPVMLTGRVVARDTELAGVRVPRGAVVTTVLAGANRDPEVFADPGRFDVTRENARDHVSFSAGRHYCLGAALARMEGEVGLRALFDRFPDLAMRAGAVRRRTRILRGFETLPVVLA